MAACCEEWALGGIEPRNPPANAEQFREKHNCPTCKKAWWVLFQAVEHDEGIEYAVLGIDPYP